MRRGDVIDRPFCTGCGYNTLSGKASRGRGQGLGGLTSGVLSGGRSNMLGVLCCVGGTVLGAGIWFAVGYFTNYEIGYIAILVGALAGLGMLMGFGQPSAEAGVIAAVAAILGIVAAKFALFSVSFGSYLAPPSTEGRTDREVLAEFISRDLYEVPDLPESASDDEWEAAAEGAADKSDAEAERQVAAMDDSQVAQNLAAKQEEWKGKLSSLWTALFYKAMFAPLDLLFFALAVGAAFKVGSTGWGE